MTDRKFAKRTLVYLVLAVLFSVFGVYVFFVIFAPITYLFGGGSHSGGGAVWIGVFISAFIYPLILLLIPILLSKTISSRIAYLNLSRAWIPLGIFYPFVGAWAFYQFRGIEHLGFLAALEGILSPGFHLFLLIFVLFLCFYEGIPEGTLDRRQKPVLVACYVIGIHQFMMHQLQFLDVLGMIPILPRSFLWQLRSAIAAVWPSRDIVLLGLSGSTILWIQFVVFTIALASLLFPPGRLSPKQAG